MSVRMIYPMARNLTARDIGQASSFSTMWSAVSLTHRIRVSCSRESTKSASDLVE